MFFGKFSVLFYLETPVLRFALLPYYRQTIISTALHPSKDWKWLVDGAYLILKHTDLERYGKIRTRKNAVFGHFSRSDHIINLYQNINYRRRKQLGTSVFWHFIETKQWKDVYWYIGSLHTLISTYTTALTILQVARKVLFLPCLTEHIPLSPIIKT